MERVTIPHLHTLWPQQVKLEEEMLTEGADRIRSRINKLKEGGKDLTGLRPYRSLLLEWVLPVSTALEKWLYDQNHKRGVRPISAGRLLNVPRDVAALVALKVMLKRIGVDNRNISSVALEIGTMIEHEAKAVAWRRIDEKGWNRLSKKYKEQGSNAAHQARSRNAIFNTYIADDIGWQEWSHYERQRVGLTMMDLVITTTKRFRIIPDPAWNPHKYWKTGKANPKSRNLVLAADEELLVWLKGSMDDEIVHKPAFMPTIMPPKPWTGPRNGGYWTPFVKTPFLIRFKAYQEDTRQRALDEFDAIDMPQVYDALNTVQEAAWKINKPVLDIASRFFENQLVICNLPQQEPDVVPTRPCTYEEDKEAYKEWARKASRVHAKNATMEGDFKSTRRTIKLAEKFRDVEAFYFPHMLDFRGRMYPIVSDLSPQGNDLNKGLLLSAIGKKVPREDAMWLAVRLANSFGVDKVSMGERVQWVEENNDLWKRIAADPLENLEWTSADGGDSPWQALAAILEWAGWLADPENFVSHIVVYQDGSCNGIQHLSAMVLDTVGGRAVNLIPSDHPNDIYREVADILTRKLEEEALAGVLEAHVWLAVTGGSVTRALTKRPVMVLPYGGTRHSYFKYINEWLDKHDPDFEAISEDDRFKYIWYMIRHMWKAVSEHLTRPMEVMEWIKENAAIACATGKPVWWITPSGFHCRQFYGTSKERRIETLIDGQRYMLKDYEMTNVLDPQAQAKAIAPNFVHSQDASCLTMTVNKVYACGVDFMTVIHDSYGGLAADMWTIYACIREAFIENYSRPVLEEFQEACKQINPNAKKWPELLPDGELDIEEIRHSDYFFA